METLYLSVGCQNSYKNFYLYFNRLSRFPEVGMDRAQLIGLPHSCRKGNFWNENWQWNLQIVRIMNKIVTLGRLWPHCLCDVMMMQPTNCAKSTHASNSLKLALITFSYEAWQTASFTKLSKCIHTSSLDEKNSAANLYFQAQPRFYYVLL